jgi:hypothetical protein
MSGPLVNLFRALHDLEFEKPLKRRPVFLIGGFDAWLDYAGMNWVQGHGVDGVRNGQPNSTYADTSSVSSAASVSSTSSHTQSRAILTKLSQGGGINRHDGRVIMQNLGEYVCHQSDWGSVRCTSLPKRVFSNASFHFLRSCCVVGQSQRWPSVHDASKVPAAFQFSQHTQHGLSSHGDTLQQPYRHRLCVSFLNPGQHSWLPFWIVCTSAG